MLGFDIITMGKNSFVAHSSHDKGSEKCLCLDKSLPCSMQHTHRAKQRPIVMAKKRKVQGVVDGGGSIMLWSSALSQFLGGNRRTVRETKVRVNGSVGTMN